MQEAGSASPAASSLLNASFAFDPSELVELSAVAARSFVPEASPPHAPTELEHVTTAARSTLGIQ
jgi:hypothetical protein